MSQGSVVTQLRCGGMFSNHFMTNFPQNAPVKKFWQSVNIWQRYGQNFVACFFGPPCTCSWKSRGHAPLLHAIEFISGQLLGDMMNS